MDTSNQLNSVSQNHRDDCCACVCATVDGNQITVKTSTGIWQVEYNGENRPVKFTQGDTIITMDYDYMGRRFAKTVNGNTQLFVYDNYLQIAELNEDSQIVKSYIWDPTAGYASRPLVANLNNAICYYAHDANKNVVNLLSEGKWAQYVYSPFGAVTVSSGSLADVNPFQFASEYHDSDLGLMYYNYRHYNPLDGRWLSRDPIEEEGGYNLYGFVRNNTPNLTDLLGMTAPRGMFFFRNYPNYNDKSQDEVWDIIGGSVGPLLKGQNSCAARINVAILKLGRPVNYKKIDYVNTVTKNQKGVPGNYIVNAQTMSDYLKVEWGTKSECSTTKAYYFSSNAADIDALRKEILEKLADKKAKGCECRENYVAVVFSASTGGGVSGHIGVVTETYDDNITPYAQPSDVWILPDPKTKPPAKKTGS